MADGYRLCGEGLEDSSGGGKEEVGLSSWGFWSPADLGLGFGVGLGITCVLGFASVCSSLPQQARRPSGRVQG